MQAPPTQRLYLEDPTRKTALATVTGHASGGFLLDRTIFHAADARYHHVQPDDRGHVLAEGHKLKLDRVHLDARGHIVHRTSGPMPAPGAKAQLHLDAPRRETQARAHAAMHLLIAALAEARCEILDAPRVVGQGEARFLVRTRDAPDAALARVLDRAQALVDAREEIVATWRAREDAAREITHHVVALDAVAPGEPTLRLVRCGSASVLPCDAPLVARTSQIGPLRVAHHQATRQGIRWGVKVG